MGSEITRVSKLLTYIPPLAREGEEKLKLGEGDKKRLVALITELKDTDALSDKNIALLDILKSLGFELNPHQPLSEYDKEFFLTLCESSESIDKQLDNFTDEIFGQCFAISISSDNKTIDRSKLDSELKNLKENEKELLEQILRYGYFKDLNKFLHQLHGALNKEDKIFGNLILETFCKDEPDRFERDVNLIKLDPQERELVDNLVGLTRKALNSKDKEIVDNELLGCIQMIAGTARDEVSRLAIGVKNSEAK